MLFDSRIGERKLSTIQSYLKHKFLLLTILNVWSAGYCFCCCTSVIILINYNYYHYHHYCRTDK